MKFILSGGLCIFQLLAFAAAEFNESSIEENQASPRILGGENAKIEDFPYQVSLRRPIAYSYGEMEHFCGGSIVSQWHIVTAAHCVEDILAPAAFSKIKVVSGTSRSDTGGKVHGIKSIKMHPEYRGARGDYFNDIAVVTLSDSIKFSRTEHIVHLPTSDVKNRARAIFTGWGYTSHPDGRTPIYLKKASMTLITSDQCEEALPYSLRRTQVCGYISGQGTGVCSGDSGGPLVVNGRLVGVASFVVECGAGYPDVYTNVYPYVNFIKGVMNAKKFNFFDL